MKISRNQQACTGQPGDGEVRQGGFGLGVAGGPGGELSLAPTAQRPGREKTKQTHFVFCEVPCDQHGAGAANSPGSCAAATSREISDQSRPLVSRVMSGNRGEGLQALTLPSFSPRPPRRSGRHGKRGAQAHHRRVFQAIVKECPPVGDGGEE